jgi:hypothetical protein
MTPAPLIRSHSIMRSAHIRRLRILSGIDARRTLT